MTEREHESCLEVSKRVSVGTLLVAIVYVVISAGTAFTLQARTSDLERRMERIEGALEAIPQIQTDIQWIKKDMQRRR